VSTKLILDFDATDDPLDGKSMFAAENPRDCGAAPTYETAPSKIRTRLRRAVHTRNTPGIPMHDLRPDSVLA
jgi:hypothetical protein